VAAFCLGGGEIYIDEENWGEAVDCVLEIDFETEEIKKPVNINGKYIMRLEDEVARATDVKLRFSIDKLSLSRWQDFLMKKPKKCTIKFVSSYLKGHSIKIEGPAILKPDGSTNLISEDWIRLPFIARFRQEGGDFINISQVG